MSKFKYILFPDGTYSVTFEDFNGEPFTADVKGQEMIDALRKSYALDKFLEELDKPEETK